jgi:7-carboxy-7-deazaguanine synthase (Cx14CxxC type)
MSYAVKEIFYTLQGEGRNSGRPAVFCRFSGCNLWSGREADRATAVCKFCDTDFVGTNGLGGGKFENANELAMAVRSMWPAEHTSRRLVVCTGGEPLLQLDTNLIEALHSHGFEIAIETNGTIPVPFGVDWVCVSPKHGANLVVRQGNELKVVFPQEHDPKEFELLDFQYFYIQAMDGSNQSENLSKAVSFCLENPRWNLSLQTHKLLHIR